MIVEFLIIFIAKLFEITLHTLRAILVNKRKIKIVPIIAFVEIFIWMLIVSQIITGITEYPHKMIAYALGYSLGQVVGLMLENRLALGLIHIQIILDREEGEEFASFLRKKNIAVTIIDGEGLQSEKKILLLYAPRKKKDEMINIINCNYLNNPLVTITEVNTVYGGYGFKRNGLFSKSN